MRQDVKQKAKRREIYNEIKELRRELRQREVRRMSSVCPPNRALGPHHCRRHDYVFRIELRAGCSATECSAIRPSDSVHLERRSIAPAEEP